MVDIVNIGFRAESSGIRKAKGDMDDLNKSGKNYESQGENVKKTNSSLTDSFKKYAGVIGIAGVAGGIKSLVSSFAQVEKLKAGLKTVTGSAQEAEKAFGVIKEFASSTPFALGQSVEAFTKLKTLGLDPSMEALTSYGNTAAAMNKDMNQMIEAVADAATGEFERLKEFGIKAAKQGENVSFTFQGVTTTVKNNSDAIQGYLLDIGNTQFAGAMADQMDTINGKISNAADNWETFKVKVAEVTGLGEFAKNFIGGIADVLGDMIGYLERAPEMMESFRAQLITSDSAGFVALRGMAGFFQKILDVLEPLAPFAGDVGLAIAKIAGVAAGLKVAGIAMGAIGAGMKVIGLALTANPIGLIIGGIAAAGLLIYDNWDGISEWMSGIFEDIGRGVKKLKTVWDDTFEKIQNVEDWFPTPKEILSGLVFLPKTLMSIGVDTVKGFVKGMFSIDIKAKVLEFAEKIPKPIRKFLGIASPSKMFIEIGKFVALGLASGMEKNTGSVEDASRTMATKVKGAFSDVADVITNSIVDGEGIKGVFGNLGNWLKGWIADTASNFAKNKITSGLMGLFTGGGPAANEGSLDAASGLISASTGGLGGMFASIKTGLIGAFTSVKTTFASMAASAGGLATLIGGGVAVAIGLSQALKSGGWRDVAKGIRLSVKDGVVDGFDITQVQRKRSFGRGRENSIRVDGELDFGAERFVNSVVGGMETIVNETISTLGGMSDAFSSVTLGEIDIVGDNIEEQISEWITESTGEAFRQSFESLGPVTATYVEELLGPFEDIDASVLAEELTRIATNVGAVNVASAKLNLNFDRTSATAVVAADTMVRLAGGIEKFNAQNQAYFDNYFSDQEKQQLGLAESAAKMDVFNQGLIDAGQAAINSKEELRKYIEAQDLNTTEGQLARQQAMEVAGSLNTLTEASTTASDVINGLPDNMRDSFNLMRQDAFKMYGDIERRSTEINGAHEAGRFAATGLAQAQRQSNLAMMHGIGLARQFAAVLKNTRFGSATQQTSPVNRQTVRMGFDGNGDFRDLNATGRAGGVGRVPFDGFPATLHRNEMVLTADLAERIRNIGRNGAANDSGVAEQLEVMNERQSEAMAVAKVHSQTAYKMLMETERQSNEIEQLKKANERLNRRIEALTA